MVKEGNDGTDPQLQALFKNLARRNLRRGYNLRLPTGQALHKHLKQNGAVQSAPIADVSTIFASKPKLRDFLKNSKSKLLERTPLWFYILAEAEKAGGNSLGEVGSFLVASTFVGVLLADPESGAVARFRSQPKSAADGRQQPDRLDCKMDAFCKRDGIKVRVAPGLALTAAGLLFDAAAQVISYRRLA